MLLQQPIQQVFAQLSRALLQMTDTEFEKPSTILFNATIGQHTRHIIELFLCLENGYREGIVNYEKRKRDPRIESDRNFAVQLLNKIYHQLDKPNKELLLEAEDYVDSAAVVVLPTNYYREIAYNLEHTVHHMALIRVGVNEVSSICLSNDFGIAYSTIKFRKQCAR